MTKHTHRRGRPVRCAFDFALDLCRFVWALAIGSLFFCLFLIAIVSPFMALVYVVSKVLR